MFSIDKESKEIDGGNRWAEKEKDGKEKVTIGKINHQGKDTNEFSSQFLPASFLSLSQNRNKRTEINEKSSPRTEELVKERINELKWQKMYKGK